MHELWIQRREFLQATAAGLAACAGGRLFAQEAEGVRPPITAIAISPDRKHVVVGSQAGLAVLDEELQRVREIQTGLVQIHALAFSPDGSQLLAAGGEPAVAGVLERFDWPGMKRIDSADLFDDVIYAAAWREDGRRIVLGSADQTAGIFDVATGRLLHTLRGHSKPVLAAVYLPGQRGVVTAGIDGTLRLWNEQTGESIRSLDNHTDAVAALALRPQGDGDALPMLASVGRDATVRFWQPTIGRMMRFARFSSVPLAATWRGDGLRLWVACVDGNVREIDPDTAKVEQEVPAINGWAYAIAAEGEQTAIVAGHNGAIRRITLPKHANQ